MALENRIWWTCGTFLVSLAWNKRKKKTSKARNQQSIFLKFYE